jgi:putative transposase
VPQPLPAGAYFVTICTRERQCLLGEIVNGEMRFNEAGNLVRRCCEDIPHHLPQVASDAFVVMSNHMHGIIVIQGRGEASVVPFHVSEERPESDASPLQRRSNGTQPGSLSAIVQNFKSISTRKIGAARGMLATPVWQRNYYEHVERG